MPGFRLRGAFTGRGSGWVLGGAMAGLEESPDFGASSEAEAAEAAIKAEDCGAEGGGAAPLAAEPVEKAARSEVKVEDYTHWMPDRVRDALVGGATFEAFRRSRKFRYLHAFSGPRDVLSEHIAEECKRERLEFEAVSLDRKTDRSLDLSKVGAYQALAARIDGGEFDGFHGGFPCSSFSMARYNNPTRGPPPVRSGEEIYGLATNDRAQQREADLGTLMASQCAWLRRSRPSRTHRARGRADRRGSWARSRP